MRRQTRASKGQNSLSVEADAIVNTKHLGGGEIVEEIETMEDLRAEISLLKNKNMHLEKKIIEISNKKKGSQDISKIKEVESDLVKVAATKELQSVSSVNLMLAIESEMNIQCSKDVIITRKMMIDQYNVNTAFITIAIKALTSNGFIRVNTLTERKRTFTKLKDLPAFN